MGNRVYATALNAVLYHLYTFHKFHLFTTMLPNISEAFVIEMFKLGL